LAAVVSGLLLLGASIRDTWRKQAADLIYRAAAIIRASGKQPDPNASILAAMLGQRTRSVPAIVEKGNNVAGSLLTKPQTIDRAAPVTFMTQAKRPTAGEIGSARQRAQSIVQTSVSSTASDARRATFKANGVRAMQWHGVLDSKICPVCAIRAGKLWTVDGEPIGHNIPYLDIPCHYWDRCLWLPLAGEPPADGGPGLHTFETWMATLSEAEQDTILGKGRAQLYRDGTITLNDLLDQRGQVLTLAELRATL
jgi:SPP1 gp7 family putative phage head morphogenesis protein